MTRRKAEQRCATCGRTFKYPYLLNQHIRVHSGATPYTCLEVGCGRSFKWLSSLKAHQNSHDGGKTVEGEFNDEASLVTAKSGNSELEGLLEDLLENPAAPIEETALYVFSEESNPWKAEDNAKSFGVQEDTNFDSCFNFLDIDGTYPAFIDGFLSVIPEQV